MKLDIPPIFSKKTVTIVAGGPSLTGFDFSILRPPVVAVNNSVYMCESDMLVAIDNHWWTANLNRLNRISYRGYMVTINGIFLPRMKRLELTPNHEERNEDWHVQKANLSGYTALAVAIYLGAKKVFLLGFDGGFTGARSNYYNNLSNPYSQAYEEVNELYGYYTGRDIINVGPSRIEAFPRRPLKKGFYDG